MISMAYMFAGATFHGDISRWDVSRVTDMNSMFTTATKFDCNISKWDVSKVTNMDKMFKNAALFQQ